ncbi:MAG: acetylglutamate kinase [Deltaproteobacteria bacterium]|nr:acetylglutamate kinase [Deltaproteobacteria bacterium]
MEYRGTTVVIKIGGHAMLSSALLDGFAEDVTLLKLLGFKPVVAHGGGPQIDALLKRLNIETSFREGLRLTDPETMKAVEMVLCGSVGKDIVSRISRAGGSAVGLSGKDCNFIAVEKEYASAVREDGTVEMVDIGFVGRPSRVDPEILNHLTAGGFIPVVAPVGVDAQGAAYNINADTLAAALAIALKARRLILLTDVSGVLDENGELLVTLSASQIADLKKRGLIKGGMIPKLDCCLRALEQGCGAASVIDGRVSQSLLLEIFTHKGCGTEITL